MLLHSNKLFNFACKLIRRSTSTSTEVQLLLKNSSKKAFIKHDESFSKVPIEQALVDAKIIGYYFSASWCTHCVMLLPKIKKLYQENLSRNRRLVIVYVSLDEDLPTFLEYFTDKHGKWYAVPYGDTLIEFLLKRFKIENVPHVIIVNMDGNTITLHGRKDIETDRDEAINKWLESA